MKRQYYYMRFSKQACLAAKFIAMSMVMSMGIQASALKNDAFAVNNKPLPELNDSASLVLNPAQEKVLGQQIMLKIRAQTRLSEDALLLDYLSNLAQTLVKHSPGAFGEIKMNMAIDEDINAYAVPGGYITLNSGLVAQSKSEAELAAVIAHEIGHHSQRHIARKIERSKQMSLPAAAGIVGGLLLGGQAGLAAILSSQAAIGADQLSYSRNFEREADAIGMQILNLANYPPIAMTQFFTQLEKQSRLYGGDAPPFLLTHPVSSDRIADSLSRLKTLKPPKSSKSSKSSRAIGQSSADTQDENTQNASMVIDYAHVKARIQVLYSESLAQTISQFKQSPASLSAQYGLSLALMRSGEHAKAEKVLSKLLAKHPNHALMAFSQAELKLGAHQFEQAAQALKALQVQGMNNPAIDKAYAQALFGGQKFAPLSKLLRKYIRHQPAHLWAYELLAQTQGAQGNTLNAVIVKAEQQQIMGRYKAAIRQLKNALKSPHDDKSPYLEARVKDLIKQNAKSQAELEAFTL